MKKLITKEIVDKRTVEGKRLVEKIKSLDKKEMESTAFDFGLHPALILLRIEDILWMRSNINPN